jgi:hypothetical protein
LKSRKLYIQYIIFISFLLVIEPPQPPQPIPSTSAQTASPSTEEEEQGQEKQPETVAQPEIETSQKAISMEVEEDEEIICTFSHNVSLFYRTLDF